MNLTTELLPSSWALQAHGVFLLIFLYAVYRMPWHWFKKSHNVFFGFCVGLMVLWTIKAGIRPGLEYHFLGATLFTLMFGWQMAIIGLSIVMLAMVFGGYSQWQMFSVNMMIMAVIPVIISHVIYTFVAQKMYHHYFVYIFPGVFFNAGITIALTVLASSLFMVAGGAYSMDLMLHEYMPYIALMIYPEAFITGLVVIIMSVYFPRFVHSFDEEKFSMGK